MRCRPGPRTLLDEAGRDPSTLLGWYKPGPGDLLRWHWLRPGDPAGRCRPGLGNLHGWFRSGTGDSAGNLGQDPDTLRSVEGQAPGTLQSGAA